MHNKNTLAEPLKIAKVKTINQNLHTALIKHYPKWCTNYKSVQLQNYVV